MSDIYQNSFVPKLFIGSSTFRFRIGNKIIWANEPISVQYDLVSI